MYFWQKKEKNILSKSKDTLIGVGGALLLAFAVIMSLNNTSNLANDSNTSSAPAAIPSITTPVSTTPKPASTPASTKATTKAQTTKAPETTPATTPEPLEWAEDAINATMYVNQGCYSRTRAIMGSDTVRTYSYGETVHVIAITDTGYYKLDSGEYIHGDYLSES